MWSYQWVQQNMDFSTGALQCTSEVSSIIRFTGFSAPITMSAATFYNRIAWKLVELKWRMKIVEL